MREFYFEDKLRHSIVMGVCSHDDLNWKPLDYYMYSSALARGNLYNRIMDLKGRPEWADKVESKQMICHHQERYIYLSNVMRNSNLFTTSSLLTV